MKTTTYDLQEILGMSYEQKKQILPKLNKIANQRLRELEKKGKTNWAYDMAKKDLKMKEKPRYRQNYKTEHGLDNRLTEVISFINAKSSTMTGRKEIFQRQIESFREGRASKTKALLISDEKKFKAFLDSNMLESLKDKADSSFIFEDIDLAIQNNYTIDEILQAYQKYIDTDMTFNEIEEERRRLRNKNVRTKRKKK